MAIARKPTARIVPPSSASEREIEALIRKGGSVAVTPAARPKAAGTAKVILRLPDEMLARVDALVEARSPKIPRHTWLLEAILEKLERETPK
ncbi:hypothetical protein [Acuticoccus mangrovi]|uniref:Uncharacterized protein n=1 Tax=Acuticoccus mangrovi TaxID=2796142 RepID=A0A934MIG8_9HYPH|nr:hypothetical protein [Acuticoccus mangrovi]MBJ3778753.1 hypothetical protein [Acuticoccus mangrovi]